jgi:glycosyltransferase involved in cell wall biosynthesis
MRIRILYLIGSFEIGGAQRHLVEVLKRINRAKFAPYIAVLDGGGSLLANVLEMGLPFYSLSIDNLLYHPSTLLKVLRFAAYLRRERIQVIHTYLYESDVIGLLAGLMARVPVKITSRRSMLFLRNRGHELLASRILHLGCDRVIAVCEAVRVEAIRREGLPASKISAINNGVDLPRYQGGNPPPRDLLSLRNGKPLIGMVATLKPIKDIHTFLKALYFLDQWNSNWLAMLVGDGPLRHALEKEARVLGLEDKVVFIGQRDDIQNVIPLMDISVLSSRSEGMSNALLESMAAAKPVIASNVGGNPEVVEDGVTGILLPPSDPQALAFAMMHLLQDKERATKMGQAGRKRIEKLFLLDDMVRTMETVYEDLLAIKGLGG